MTTWVVGDLQGCLDPLDRLLERVRFDPASDRLWLVGDLVNRGPDSAGVLRRVMQLGTSAVTVLGNHDLHLVASAVSGQARRKDTFHDVLDAPDRDALLRWLRTRPLVHFEHGTLLVHAGVDPTWTLDDALSLAREASAQIADSAGDDFFRDQMYGNQPQCWDATLRGWDRLRFVINTFTRLRLCDSTGRADYASKGAPTDAPPGQRPWFETQGRRTSGTPIVFGHWSLLGQVHWPEHGVHGLDTGCVWGGPLTALNLEQGHLVSVPGLAPERAVKPGN